MTSYFIELNEYKPQNRKCAEMAEFANQFGNTLCPDKISFDAFKTELEAKVKELNEKYPKTMPLKISSGSGFIHIDQDTKTHNNGCDKPVAYFFIYRVKRIYRFSERPQIEKKDTMFVAVQNNRSSGRVVPPLAAGRSPTDD